MARARTLFFHLLNNRGFRGRLLVNHKQRKLDLVVCPSSCSARFSKTNLSLTPIYGYDRSSRTRQRPAKAARPKPFPAERNLSQQSASYYLCGKQWAPQSAVSMNCKPLSFLFIIQKVLLADTFFLSDVFMDSVNRDVSMKMMVREKSPHP